MSTLARLPLQHKRLTAIIDAENRHRINHATEQIMVDISTKNTAHNVPIWQLLLYLADRKYQTLPNSITASRIIISPIIVAMALTGCEAAWILLLVIVGSSTDCLDGEVARRLNQCSEYGKYLDQIADKIFGFALLAPVYIWEGPNIRNVTIGVLVVIYTWIVVWIRKRGYARTSSPIAKWKTAVQYIAAIVYFTGHTLASGPIVVFGYWVMYASLALMLLSLIVYLQVAHRESQHHSCS